MALVVTLTVGESFQEAPEDAAIRSMKHFSRIGKHRSFTADRFDVEHSAAMECVPVLEQVAEHFNRTVR